MIAVGIKRGRPTREAAAVLPRKLIETARAMFIAYGYSGTTMEALAREAHISKKTIYSQYADKAALFRDVMNGMVQSRIRETLAEEDDTPLAEGLRRRAKMILDNALTPQAIAFYKLLQRESGQFPELGIITDRQNEDALFQPLSQYFEACKRRGEMRRDMASDWAARLFVFLVFGDLNNRLLMGLKAPAMESVEEYVEQVCGLFLKGINAT